MSEDNKKEATDLERSDSQPSHTEPDVILDIPKLKVGEIKMDVENLEANISVKAQLANFVNIEVGTRVYIEKVKLEIKEVEAEAYLRVRLKKIENILLKTLQSLDENPDLLNHLLHKAENGLKEGLQNKEKTNETTKDMAEKIGNEIKSLGKSLGDTSLGHAVQKAGEKIAHSDTFED